MRDTFLRIIRTEGVIGLYRGAVPPLCGSGFFRSIQFAAFEAVYTALGSVPATHSEIPFTGGLQPRVVFSGMVASTARAIIETPLEYCKVRGQTGQTWQFRQLYTGFGVTWCRTTCLMTTYFILIDSGRRHFPQQFSQPVLGPFLASGLAATTAWWLVWPLEVVKSQVQSGYGDKNLTVLQRMRLIVRERGGWMGLYRGITPGTIRSFLSNGTSMVVMQWGHREVSRRGWRDL